MRAARGCPAIRVSPLFSHRLYRKPDLFQLIVCIRPSLDCDIEFDVIEEETKENQHVNSVKLGMALFER